MSNILYISVVTIIGYRFVGVHIAFQYFVPLSLLEGVLSLYSDSFTSLTKVFLQYYSGFQPV